MDTLVSKAKLRRIQETHKRFGNFLHWKAPEHTCFSISFCLQLTILSMECIQQNNSDGVKIGVTRGELLCTESMGEQNKSGRLILVAMDESEESISALQWASNNLFASQDRVILIHAQRSPTSPLATASPVFMVPVDVLKMLEKDIKRSTEKILARATEICKAKNVTPKMEARIGDAKEVICKAAKKHNPDLLVVGSHGSGALKRVFLGSLSDYCVTHVQCPVVVVRPQKNKDR